MSKNCPLNEQNSKNMLLLKIHKFYPIITKLCQNEVLHENLILTKFRNDWVKIVDFLLKAYFCLSPDLHVSECS